jgi:hypothetical protein
VRYLLLWTTFNGLYNVAEMPRRKLKKPVAEGGLSQPRVTFIGERTKLRRIANMLSKDTALVNSLAEDHAQFIRDIERRRPSVRQPDNAREIQYQVGGEAYVFEPKEARGVASLDNRVVLADGHKIFEFASLSTTRASDGAIADPKQFMRELLLILYQIRNNVAHGGAAAFFKRGNKVSQGAIEALNVIVQYLFDNQRILLADK